MTDMNSAVASSDSHGSRKYAKDWAGIVEAHWLLAAGSVLALALIARLIHINRGMWIDELKTWQIVQWPMSEMLADRFREGHLPLYFVFMRGWNWLVGASAWGLRLPSVIAGVWAVFLTLRLGQEGFSRRVALTGALVMAIHAADVWSSQTVRMYGFLSCLTVAGSLQLVRLERTGRWRHFLGLSLVSAIGLATQALYGLFMVTQILYLIWNNGRRVYRKWKVLAALLLGLAAAWPVYAMLAAQQAGIQPTEHSKWEVSVGRMYRYITSVALGDYPLVGVGKWFRIPLTVCLIATILGFVAAFRRRGIMARLAEPEAVDAQDGLDRARSLTRYIVCWVGGYLVVMFFFSNLVQNMAGHPRYYTPINGGLALAFAVSIHAIARSRIRQAFAVALVASLLTVTTSWWLYTGDGMVDALQTIESQRGAGERVIGCDDVAGMNAYRFYWPAVYEQTFVGLVRDEYSVAAIAELLRNNAAPGQRLWLLVYHEKKSPLVAVANQDKEFETLSHETFRDAQVWCLRRKAPPG